MNGTVLTVVTLIILTNTVYKTHFPPVSLCLVSLIERLVCQVRVISHYLLNVGSNQGQPGQDWKEVSVFVNVGLKFVYAALLFSLLLLDCSEPLSSCDAPQISVRYRV